MKKYLMAGVAGLLGCAANGMAESLYWWPGADLGGGGQWNISATSWSLSPDSKQAPPAAPGSVDSAIFAGAAGVVNYTSGKAVKQFRVDTSGYLFSLPNGTVNLTIEEFGGIGLAGTTFRAFNTGALNTTFDLIVTGTTSFTGTFVNGDAGGLLILRKQGNGLLDVSSATLAQTGATHVMGGILRAREGTGTAGSLPTSQSVQLGSGGGTGILEVVGNGVSSSFTRNLSATAAAANAIGLGSSSSSVVGFGALAGNLTVNLNNNGSVKSWGGSGFLAGTLVLGTETSTGKVTWINPLDLITGGPVVSQIQVVHGGTSTQKVDAEIQGALQISGSAVGGVAIADRIVEKTGNGTLVLSGESTAFNGRLKVSAGTLLINGSFASNTTNAQALQVDAGAILGGAGTLAFTNANARIEVAGTLQAGLGMANENFGAEYQFSTLTVSQSHVIMEENSILAFGLGAGSELRDVIATTNGGVWEFDTTQRVKFYDAGLVSGTTYAIMTGLSANPFPETWQIYDSGGIDGSFSFEGGVVYFTVSQVPEPGAASLIFAASLLALSKSRRRRK
jgi:autotransporter-associated beta strand protein